MSMHSSREEYNAYMRVYMLKRYHSMRRTIIKALGGKCSRCGSRKCLELDHKDHRAKLFDLADRIHTAPRGVLVKELKKIQLLCNRCHVQKTIIERGHQPAAHGRPSMYRRGCRCRRCKNANSEYRRARRNHLVGGVANVGFASGF